MRIHSFISCPTRGRRTADGDIDDWTSGNMTEGKSSQCSLHLRDACACVCVMQQAMNCLKCKHQKLEAL